MREIRLIPCHASAGGLKGAGIELTVAGAE